MPKAPALKGRMLSLRWIFTPSNDKKYYASHHRTPLDADEASTPVNSRGKVIVASLVGTAIEFFDFYIYATAAVIVFPHIFFPQGDPTTATLQSLATFAVAFVARPIGSALFGHFGDRVGAQGHAGRLAADHGDFHRADRPAAKL